MFNQNEQALGLFYLHPDTTIPIAVPSVALLRVSAAFSSKHYTTFAEARRGRLDAQFRDKLGWLVANLFSRVATTDWHEKPGGEEELEDLIASHLDRKDGGSAPVWVKRSTVEEAQRAGVQLEHLEPDRIPEAIKEFARPDPSVEAITHVIRVIQKVQPGACSEHLLKIQNRLNNDSLFTAIFRRLMRQQ
jgi:hypothetical protein